MGSEKKQQQRKAFRVTPLKSCYKRERELDSIWITRGNQEGHISFRMGEI